MSRTVWNEVIYRCDGPLCSQESVYSHIREETIPGKPAQADRKIKSIGWKVKKDGNCYCPECARKLGDL